MRNKEPTDAQTTNQARDESIKPKNKNIKWLHQEEHNIEVETQTMRQFRKNESNVAEKKPRKGSNEAAMQAMTTYKPQKVK